MPVLRDLLLFIGIPLLITAAIFAAVYLPGVVRGESVAPAGARTDDQWFGGRRDTAELEPSTRRSRRGRRRRAPRHRRRRRHLVTGAMP